MSKKITYIATAPDGTEIKRTSARTYTHAVAVLTGPSREQARWGVYTFNGRMDLAMREANKLRNTIGQPWTSGDIDFEVAVVEAVAR